MKAERVVWVKMRPSTVLILSGFALGQVAVEAVRALVEDVDWDDPSVPEDERSVLLGIDARLTGMDEGYNDIGDLKAWVAQVMPALWNSYSPIFYITSGASNRPEPAQLWLNPEPVSPRR